MGRNPALVSGVLSFSLKAYEKERKKMKGSLIESHNKQKYGWKKERKNQRGGGAQRSKVWLRIDFFYPYYLFPTH